MLDCRWRDCRPGDRTSSDIPLVRLSVAGYKTNNNNAPRENTLRSDGDDDRIIKGNSNGIGKKDSALYTADRDSNADRISTIQGGKTETKEEELGLEFRVSTSLLPLRCYLDAHFVHFLRDLGKLYEGLSVQGDKDKQEVKESIIGEKSKQKERAFKGAGKEKEKERSKGDDTSDSSLSLGPYFQHVWIAPIMLKIDYEPGRLPCLAIPCLILPRLFLPCLFFSCHTLLRLDLDNDDISLYLPYLYLCPIFVLIYPLLHVMSCHVISGTMDLQGLQGGDYMQLLNFFPLHKMKICLR